MSDSGAIENIHKTHKYTKVISDSVATAIKAGTNLEVASGSVMYTGQKEAMKQNKLTEAEIRANVKPLFYARMKLGEFDPAKLDPYKDISAKEIQCPKHRELARQTAMMSFVLLKNTNNVLPLNSRNKMNKIAVSILF